MEFSFSGPKDIHSPFKALYSSDLLILLPSYHNTAHLPILFVSDCIFTIYLRTPKSPQLFKFIHIHPGRDVLGKLKELTFLFGPCRHESYLYKCWLKSSCTF